MISGAKHVHKLCALTISRMIHRAFSSRFSHLHVGVALELCHDASRCAGQETLTPLEKLFSQPFEPQFSEVLTVRAQTPASVVPKESSVTNLPSRILQTAAEITRPQQISHAQHSQTNLVQPEPHSGLNSPGSVSPNRIPAISVNLYHPGLCRRFLQDCCTNRILPVPKSHVFQLSG